MNDQSISDSDLVDTFWKIILEHRADQCTWCHPLMDTTQCVAAEFIRSMSRSKEHQDNIYGAPGQEKLRRVYGARWRGKLRRVIQKHYSNLLQGTDSSDWGGLYIAAEEIEFVIPIR